MIRMTVRVMTDNLRHRPWQKILKHLSSNTFHQTPFIKHLSSNTFHQTPFTKHLSSNTFHQTPFIKNLSPLIMPQTLAEKAEKNMTHAKKEAGRRLEICKRTLQRMLHIQLATAFDSFRDRIYEVKNKRENCRKIISKLVHSHLASAFDGFCECVAQLQAHRQVSYVCLHVYDARWPILHKAHARTRLRGLFVLFFWCVCLCVSVCVCVRAYQRV